MIQNIIVYYSKVILLRMSSAEAFLQIGLLIGRSVSPPHERRSDLVPILDDGTSGIS